MCCPGLKGKDTKVYSTAKPKLMITHYFLSCKILQANIYPIHFSGMSTNYLGCALSLVFDTLQTKPYKLFTNSSKT